MTPGATDGSEADGGDGQRRSLPGALGGLLSGVNGLGSSRPS